MRHSRTKRKVESNYLLISKITENLALNKLYLHNFYKYKSKYNKLYFILQILVKRKNNILQIW